MRKFLCTAWEWFWIGYRLGHVFSAIASREYVQAALTSLPVIMPLAIMLLQYIMKQLKS